MLQIHQPTQQLILRLIQALRVIQILQLQTTLQLRALNKLLLIQAHLLTRKLILTHHHKFPLLLSLLKLIQAIQLLRQQLLAHNKPLEIQLLRVTPKLLQTRHHKLLLLKLTQVLPTLLPPTSYHLMRQLQLLLTPLQVLLTQVLNRVSL